MAGEDHEDEPLKAEAAARADWRGEEEGGEKPRASGHTLPASEDEDERAGSGSGGGGSAGGEAPTGPPGTIRPPD
jgi:hypothetical protein